MKLAMLLYYALIFLGTVLLMSSGRQGWLLVFLPLVLLASVPLAVWDGLQYHRLFHAGRVEEAFEEVARRERKYARSPRMRIRLQLIKAQLYTNMGAYETSDRLLEGLDSGLDSNAEGLRLGLKSFNTFLSGGDLAAAHQDLTASMRHLYVPANHLTLAVIERELGRTGEAEASFRTFLAHKNRRRLFFGKTLLVMDKQLLVPLEQYLLGRYYLACGETAEARHHLRLAAQAPRPSLYTKLSAELLSQTG
ncbi:hypothetical protein ACVNS2_23965 [Paenibacillus caseinilyticus]|nr:hypothetical protein [Paenibacillus mucilaginosus]